MAPLRRSARNRKKAAAVPLDPPMTRARSVRFQDDVFETDLTFSEEEIEMEMEEASDDASKDEDTEEDVEPETEDAEEDSLHASDSQEEEGEEEAEEAEAEGGAEDGEDPVPAISVTQPTGDAVKGAEEEVEGEEEEEDDGFDDIVKKLVFTTKTAQTPGRYLKRHKSQIPLQVFLRIRPSNRELTAKEPSSTDAPGSEVCYSIADSSNVVFRAPDNSPSQRKGELTSKYTFSRVFGPETSQETMFMQSAFPLVDSLFAGQNGLVFAYGITNSGKTYTMQGTSQAPGLIPRVLEAVFTKLNSMQEEDDTEEGDEEDLDDDDDDIQGFSLPRFDVVCSFLEIYNEKLYDLLWGIEATDSSENNSQQQHSSSSSSKRPEIKLKTSMEDQVYVDGLREVHVNSQEQAMAVFRKGLGARRTGATGQNSDSSRSHSVFSVKLVQRPRGGSSAGRDSAASRRVWANLSLVDLAGAERTNRTRNTGKRLRETAKINTSLMQLGRCLEILRYNQNLSRGERHRGKMVPFRDSKITRLFRDSLLGWGRTVMIANVGPDPEDYDETMHALRYASIASEIKLQSRLHEQNQRHQQHQRQARLARKKRERLAAQATRRLQQQQQQRGDKLSSMSPAVMGRTASRSLRGQSNRRGRKGIRAGRLAPLEEEPLDFEESNLDEEEFGVLLPLPGSAAETAGGFDATVAEARELELLNEIYQLKQEIVEAEARCAWTESRVREEVFQDNEQQMAEMEEMFQEQLDMERRTAQRTYQQKLELLHMDSLTALAAVSDRADGSGGMEALRRVHEIELAQLRAQHEQELHMKSSRLARTDSEKRGLETKLEELQQRFQDLEIAHREQGEALAAATQSRSELQARLDRASIPTDAAAEPISGPQDSREQLQTAHSKITELRNQVQREKKDKATKTAALEQELAQAKQQQTILEQRSSRQQSRLAQLESQKKEHVASQQALQGVIDTQERELRQQALRIKELEKEVRQLRQSLKKLEREDARRSMAHQKQLKEKDERQALSLKAVQEEQELKLKELQEELQCLQEGAGVQEEVLIDKEQQIQQQSSIIRKLQAKCESLQEQLESLGSSLSGSPMDAESDTSACSSASAMSLTEDLAPADLADATEEEAEEVEKKEREEEKDDEEEEAEEPVQALTQSSGGTPESPKKHVVLGKYILREDSSSAGDSRSSSLFPQKLLADLFEDCNESNPRKNDNRGARRKRALGSKKKAQRKPVAPLSELPGSSISSISSGGMNGTRGSSDLRRVSDFDSAHSTASSIADIYGSADYSIRRAKAQEFQRAWLSVQTPEPSFAEAAEEEDSEEDNPVFKLVREPIQKTAESGGFEQDENSPPKRPARRKNPKSRRKASEEEDSDYIPPDTKATKRLQQASVGHPRPRRSTRRLNRK